MSDLKEIFEDIASTQERRGLSRLEENLRVLRAQTIPFAYHANIRTVLIRAPGYPYVDFYASQGKWKICSTGRIVFGDAQRLLGWLWEKGPKKGTFL